jgi:hypothetical protein
LLLCIAAHSDILSACTRVHALCAYKLVNKMRVAVLLPVLLLVLGITLAAGVGNNDGADDGRDQHHGAAWWPVGHKRPLASKLASKQVCPGFTKGCNASFGQHGHCCGMCCAMACGHPERRSSTDARRLGLLALLRWLIA